MTYAQRRATHRVKSALGLLVGTDLYALASGEIQQAVETAKNALRTATKKMEGKPPNAEVSGSESAAPTVRTTTATKP
jgi:hypothetical protein